MANCWLKGREKGRAPEPLSQCRLPWLVLTQGSLPIAILAQANLAQAILAQAILAESTSCTAGRVWGDLLALALVRVASPCILQQPVGWPANWLAIHLREPP